MVHDDTPPPLALELRVLAGAQAGARCPLALGRTWRLAAGTAAGDDDGDVLLQRQGAPVRLRVQPQGADARAPMAVAVLEGDITLAGQRLATGDAAAWRAAEPLLFDDGTAVAWGPAHEPLWLAAPGEPADPASRPTGTPSGEPAVAVRPGGAFERWLAVGGAALALGSGALWLLAELAAPLPPARAGAPVAAAAAPDAAAAVAEVFRLHGLRVRTELAPDGSVQVDAPEGDAQRVQAARTAALRDVPGLRTVALRQAPAPQPEGRELPADPGKRITAVVADADLPYLVTADGSRYFVGALLPSGHRVRLIAEREVTIEREGRLTQLAL